jgi:hypothetical protein
LGEGGCDEGYAIKMTGRRGARDAMRYHRAQLWLDSPAGQAALAEAVAPPASSVSGGLAAEIREALAATARGEAEDLGSFAQYADDEDMPASPLSPPVQGTPDGAL